MPKERIIKIIFEDNDFLVVEKPSCISVTKEGRETKENLEDYLKAKFPYLRYIPRGGIVHRLDKETSGLILVAKGKLALKFFQKQFKEKKVIKKYLALVRGKIKEDKGEIKSYLLQERNSIKIKAVFPFDPEAKKRKLREAILKFKVKEKFKDYTLLEIQPLTGRKHQIRVQLASIGHPVFGDKLYGGKIAFEERKILKRHFLHNFYLKFKLLNGKDKEFKIKLPQELKELLNKLKKNYES